ncbi:MAG: hypothetical protein AAFV88_09915 [Planctomycetota bacterium]
MNHFPDQANAPKIDCYENGGDYWVQITHSQVMDEFFMMPLSSSDHWMFVSSNGAITAGRRNEDSALFPYYSADKLIDTAGSSGPKTIFHVANDSGVGFVWEPFSRCVEKASLVTRRLYKNSLSNQLSFEETHHSLQLVFRYTWTFSNEFGFVRDCCLTNLDSRPVQISMLDGLQNVLPSGIDSKFQSRFSNLADAYKLSEMINGSRVGVFYLSSIPTDRAEPSEGLRATTVWQDGLENTQVLLSDSQLDQFRRGRTVEQESVSRGRRGAYLVTSRFELAGSTEGFTPGPLAIDRQLLPHQKNWLIVADVNRDQGDVVSLAAKTSSVDCARRLVATDVQANENRLREIVSACDGIQQGGDPLRLMRHRSNVLFNVMRGGMPPKGYQIQSDRYSAHVLQRNRIVWSRNESFFQQLDEEVSYSRLMEQVDASGDEGLIRLTLEYLPFTFSRRHGDPSRPWNRFSIDFVEADGTESLRYQGNWRDIFQNWEALSLSFPEFAAGMVFRFVNASTADGYNPYRVTQDGVEWETLDPEDPWANIGYWGDHQIIYLAKLLEWTRAFTPDKLGHWLGREVCSYVQVPYRIGCYLEICDNPQESIRFDDEIAARIEHRVGQIGSDGKLLHDVNEKLVEVSLAEKLIVPIAVKLSNFIPGGGLWLNTQRPEWNDANNALVGNGLSVVTACYMRRYLTQLIQWFEQIDHQELFTFSNEVAQFVSQIGDVLRSHRDQFAVPMEGKTRKRIVDQLSQTGCRYRSSLYQDGWSGEKTEVRCEELLRLLKDARHMVDQTIWANRREDGLFHSYNLMEMDSDSIQVRHLYEMLEGQVAVISSGLLDAENVCGVLDALRESAMYRSDQGSYMLYPDRELPRFLEKNRIVANDAEHLPLLQRLVRDGNTDLLFVDPNGEYRFNADFRNAGDLECAIDKFESDPEYSEDVAKDRERLLELYEETFQHDQFTGRSGTFFAYEGLGSIYWHMVSKLALAALENCLSPGVPDDLRLRLRTKYREIREGLGLSKSPSDYGAFPTDAYSHTPKQTGAQQPGMTGQVKEDVLTRLGEIGVRIEDGQLSFDTSCFDERELLPTQSVMEFTDLRGQRRRLPLAEGSFAFTYCQTPVTYRASSERKMVLDLADGTKQYRDSFELTRLESESIFNRKGEITHVEIRFQGEQAL